MTRKPTRNMTSKSATKKTAPILAALLGAGALLSVGMSTIEMGTAQMGPGIAREGDAARQEALREIETKPFAVELFDGLDGWTLGQALDAEAIAGKVVLVGVVADDPQSMMAFSSLARHQRKHADKGLVVLAVHPETQWDAINEKVNAGRIKVQVARDAGGAFAAGVLADNYPDFFLIDRAGQLRYADIENKSLKAAIGQLLRESVEEAIANAELQAQGIEVAIEEAKPKKKEILPAKYTRADWPQKNTGKLNAKNVQGKQLPVPLGNEEWLTKEKDLEGKVLVLDFWATWCGPCRRASPMLDKLQRKYEGKLEVLAISGQSEDEGTVRKYIGKKKNAYSHLFDKKQSIYRKLEIRAIPHTIIMSTDGVIRWQGNPLNPAFEKAVEQVIAQDPMFED